MKFAKVNLQWMAEHGLLAIHTMRKNNAGTECVLHAEYLAPFSEELEVLDFPVYEHDSQEFRAILDSPEWTRSDEEQIPESTEFTQVAAIQNMLRSTKSGIQTMALTDNESLKVLDLFPAWSEFLGKELSPGMKVVYEGKLYKVRAYISVVLENQFPSINTAALYEEINEEAAGTISDPIPYNNNMELIEGKYYSQDSVTYKCTRSTGQAVYNPLSDLVGIYVELAENK